MNDANTHWEVWHDLSYLCWCVHLVLNPSAHGQRVPERWWLWLHLGIQEERHIIMVGSENTTCGIISIRLLQRKPDTIQSLWSKNQSIQPQRRRSIQSDCSGPLCWRRWVTGMFNNPPLFLFTASAACPHLLCSSVFATEPSWVGSLVSMKSRRSQCKLLQKVSHFSWHSYVECKALWVLRGLHRQVCKILCYWLHLWSSSELIICHFKLICTSCLFLNTSQQNNGCRLLFCEDFHKWRWLGLCVHSRGFLVWIQAGSFCVECACSPRACVGSLRVPPSAQKHACQVNWWL